MDRKFLKQLPADARQKFEALSRKSDAAFAELRGLADERAAALERLHEFSGTRRREDESEKQTKENNDREKDYREDIARVQSISIDAAQASATVRSLAGRCTEWIEFVVGNGSRLLPMKVAGPQNLNITSVRRKLTENARQIEQAERAPALHSDLLARSMGALDALAHLGRPSVNPTERHGDPFNLTDKLSLFSLVAAPGGVGQAYLTSGSVQFLAWLLRDLLEQKITDLVASARQEGALDNAARDNRLRELSDERLVLERQEELLIEASERAGTPIARRPDCDVRAVLGVVDA